MDNIIPKKLDLKNMVFYSNALKNKVNLTKLKKKNVVDSEQIDEAEFQKIVIKLLFQDKDFLVRLTQTELAVIKGILLKQMTTDELGVILQLYLKSSGAILSRPILGTDKPKSNLSNKAKAADRKKKKIMNHRKIASFLIPEFNIRSNWLFINCTLNDYNAVALLDSGAQVSAIDKDLVEKIGLAHLIDRSYRGTARGLGKERIYGRINLVLLGIENVTLLSSFAIILLSPLEVIIGLDNLKKHKCAIDFGKKLLHIKTTDTKTRFLEDHELPRRLFDNNRRKFELSEV